MFVDRDSCKSALSWLYMLFYITQGVLMAAFAPAIIPAGLVSNLSRFHFLGQICQPFSWWLVFSTSYPPAYSTWTRSCRHGDFLLVISSWWFRFGDFDINYHRTSVSSSEASTNSVHFNLSGTCPNWSSCLPIGPSNSHLSSHWSIY